MGNTYVQPSFSVGELSPSLYGRTDLQAFHRGAATLRNMFVDYKGGASSRPGSALVGLCLQPGSGLPPIDIPFRVSLTENYVLEFGNFYMRVKAQGGYVTEAALPVTGATSANPSVLTVVGNAWSPGDWLFLSNLGGTTRLNNRTVIVAAVAGSSITLNDIFGQPLDASSYTAFTSGGTAARLFTLLTPYASADLDSLKYAQDAEVMTITNRNYPVYNLTRVAAANWTLAKVTFATSIAAPATCTVVASSTTATNPTAYSYVVTAIDAVTGEESVASPLGGVTNSVNINSLLGTLTISWAHVTGAGSYNIYKAPVSIDGTIPVGVIFGYIGTALGLSFVDTNITADFALSPPLHLDPFAVNAIFSVAILAGGSGYTATTVITVNTATGAGASLLPVIVGGVLSAIIVQNGGHDYALVDTLSITDSGGGVGASTLTTLGPSTGTYPGVVGYFQQRRVYAETINEPDTYFMSKPGAFDNMDAAAISNDSDSIIGTPWAQQVQGIQSLVQMPGGLVVFTGLGVWQVSGGAPGTAMTPSNQSATPQAYNGAHQHLQPININFDILYVQSMGSIVRDLAYNIFANIYTGTDLSVLSNHLFENYQLNHWTFAEEPYKLIWATRSDGTMLTLTYLKEQEIQGWARHDTQGFYESVCSIVEQPVNAVYTIVKRLVGTTWYYFAERFNDRLWATIEDVWAVDSGIALIQPVPVGNLTASAVDGDDEIGAVTLLLGGSNYSANPALRVDDPTGTGCELQATVVAGVITAISILTAGSGYSSPKIIIDDDSGVGAAANASITNLITLQADAVLFAAGDVGKVWRGGGGRGTVTSFISTQIITVDLDIPITAIILDLGPDETPVALPILSGQWTLTTPVATVYLEHLKGKQVCGLIDGNQVQDLPVASDGAVVLPHSASSIVLGLPFIAQIQSMNAELADQPTIQGKRKNIQEVTVRLKSSRGVSVGSNQPNASQQQNQVNIPWTNLREIQERTNDVWAGMAIPLLTGDEIVNIPGEYGPNSAPGQVCAQSACALPLTVLAFIPEVEIGDSDG